MRLLLTEGSRPSTCDHVIRDQRIQSARRIIALADSISLLKPYEERKALILAARRVIEGLT